MTVDEKRYQMVDDRTQTGEFQRGGRAAELKLAFLSKHCSPMLQNSSKA